MVEQANMRVMQVLAMHNTPSPKASPATANCHNSGVTERDYLQVIHYKTAKLFEAAGRIGASSVSPHQKVEAAWLATACTGHCFQLIDDVLDTRATTCRQVST